MNTNDANYIAGLFDGEGSIYYKKLLVKKKDKKKGYYTWQIRMELSMTDKDVVEWIWKSFKCGTFEKRNMTSKDIKGTRKTQWRWRCGYRDALYVCKILWPHSKVKTQKIEQIIDHYDPHMMEGNIVSLSQYKQTMALE